MVDPLPLLTLVKQRVIGEAGELPPQCAALDQTLSMLCSFFSIEDFLHFLNSPLFVQFARHQEPWVVFEIGLYADHTKILELIPEQVHLAIADAAMTGCFEGNVWTGQADDEFAQHLKKWVAIGLGA